MDTAIVTGADSHHFANLRVMVGSWLTHMRDHPLFVCDFGFSAPQKSELTRIAGLEVLSVDVPIVHPWVGKSLIGRFLGERIGHYPAIMWIDADALFNQRLPAIGPLLDGYDILIDAHIQSVGELVEPTNLEALGLRPDDAYFSAGWWVIRSGCLFDRYERMTAMVQGRGRLWEADAFVAAIYAEKLRIRTVCGSVWHVRGMTSLQSCLVRHGSVHHRDQPAYVVHANDSFVERDDGRRVFKRPELAGIQDRLEAVYLSAVGDGPAQGTRGPKAFDMGRPRFFSLRRRIRQRLRRWVDSI